MEITGDKLAVLEYTVRLADGAFIKGEGGPASLNFIAGYNQVLAALEKRLIGLAVGTEADFVISAAEAFGEYDEALVRTKTFTEFPEGRDLHVGKWIIATNKETQAQFSYYVKAMTSEAAVLDYNHPLAGKDLYYHVKVVHVRPALKEELEFLRPCEHNKEDEASADASSEDTED